MLERYREISKPMLDLLNLLQDAEKVLPEQARDIQQAKRTYRPALILRVARAGSELENADKGLPI